MASLVGGRGRVLPQLVVALLAAACTGGGTSAPASLLSRLQTRPFRSPTLPAHLDVTAVGVWHYADAGHVGAGYVGSAQVSIRSDVRGEHIDSVYDVFDSGSDAFAEFARADRNFRRFSPPGSVRATRLTPHAQAFCAPQAQANTTTCWLHHGTTNAIVTTTAPSSAERTDGQAVLQAMLTHLISTDA